MQPLSLSKHFTERWVERVGNWPTPEAVQHYMNQSVRVQHCRDLIDTDGRHYRVLGIYWHPELDLVIKVDEKKRVAVTVLSRELYKEHDDPAPAPSVPIRFAERVARIRQVFGFNAGQNQTAMRRSI